MKCNKRLKYNNYVAFSHFHGTAVNNSGLVIEQGKLFYSALFFYVRESFQANLDLITNLSEIR